MPDLDDLKPLERFVGNTGIPLELVVRDRDGEPVDLEGWTATGGSFILQHVTTNAVVEGAGTLAITDSENGEVTYEWHEDDVEAEGLFDVYVTLDTTGAGHFITLQWSRQVLFNRLPAVTP